MKAAASPKHPVRKTVLAARTACAEVGSPVPPGWNLSVVLDPATLSWATDYEGPTPPAHITVSGTNYSLRDHTLGFIGEARPIGALAEIGAGLFFIQCKIVRQMSFLPKHATFGDTHLIASFAFTEFRAAVELLANLREHPVFNLPSLQLAKLLVEKNPQYETLLELTRDSGKIGEQLELYYFRNKLSAHRGLSATATAQIRQTPIRRPRDMISVGQLEGLGAGAYSSKDLFNHLRIALECLLGLAKLLISLGEFVVLPSTTPRKIIVVKSSIDTSLLLSDAQAEGRATFREFLGSIDAFPREGYSPLTAHSSPCKFGKALSEDMPAFGSTPTT